MNMPNSQDRCYPADTTAECELSIVMPCLNEAETLGSCIKKARRFLQKHGVDGEVLIADNGSSDGSQAVARSHGAEVVDVPDRGYGSALRGGINAARGKYIIMGDADDSYDFTALLPFLEKMREGHELVMGNRFRGGIKPSAMPPLHRYLGNPVLTGIGRLFFKSKVGDFHCGLRGFHKEAIERLHLQTTGMEFASEMVVKATLHGLRITEVPTTLSPDGRSRPPHLRSWRDGWRHLRFLLIYSPRWLFLYPGLIFCFFGVFGMIGLSLGPVTIGRVGLDIHSLLYASLLVILGLQTLSFAIFSKVYAIAIGLLPRDQRIDSFLEYFTLERGLIAGCICILAGIIGTIFAFGIWEKASFGELNPQQTMRLAIPSITMVVLGIHLLFSSFFVSILTIKHKIDQ